MRFIEYLRSMIRISDDLHLQLQKITTNRTVSKGQYLLRSGADCTDIYFVESGLLRGFYFNDDKEITNWLALDGEFATSFYSFIARVPSLESIEVLETSELVQIPFASLQRIYTDFPETERIGRMLTENYYIRLEGRLLSMQFTTAKERYQQLLANNPLLLQRAQLGHIASYLGITQETLSRIRAQY